MTKSRCTALSEMWIFTTNEQFPLNPKRKGTSEKDKSDRGISENLPFFGVLL